MGGFVLIAPPADVPLTLQEVQLHLKLDTDGSGNSAFDSLLMDLILSATEDAENITARQIVAAQWKETWDRFPTWLEYPAGAAASGTAWGRQQSGLGVYGLAILLHKPPLIAVQSINYVDTTGTPVVLDPSQYLASTGREPAIVEAAYGQIWPVPRIQIDAVSVTYTSGYPVTSVPGSIAAGVQTVTPLNMQGIVAGTVLTIDRGASQEKVAVTAVTSTTFTAAFTKTHAAGARASAVPARIKDALKLIIGHRFRYPDEDSPVPRAAVNLLMGMNYGGYP